MKTTIVVHTPFTLRLEGDPVMSAHGLQGVIPFEPGEHEVEQAIADHWFVKHHADPKPAQRLQVEILAQQQADLQAERLEQSADQVTHNPAELQAEPPADAGGEIADQPAQSAEPAHAPAPAPAAPQVNNRRRK